MNIEKYIHECYDGKGIKGRNPKTTFIAYGADLTLSKLADDDEKLVSWYKEKGLTKKDYYLVVGRFVPENSFEVMIREFMKSKSQKDFAIITNVNDKFLNELEEKLHFKSDKRIKFVGTVYDQELLKKIRENAYTPIVGILTRMAARKYRKTGTIVIYTTHGFTFTDKSSKKNWIVYFTAEKLMSRFCDAIITINHEDYNNAKKMHCPKTYIIPSVGLDNHRFANLRINRDEYRASFGVNSKDHMILAVGELSSRKNQKIIIEALGTLDRKEQYIFVICGTAVVNSTIEEELKETASKLGVRIFLAGHRLDIPEINACADVAVIPSVREGFGMTGVEALASGVPVVGSDVQGIREYVIPGKTGYLCDPYDAHQFADAIEKIVNLPSEERAKMVIACKEKAKEFDVSKSIAAMKNIYQEVLCHDGK